MLDNSVSTTVNMTPSLRDLNHYIIPQYAVQWKVIGTQLGLHTGILDIIEFSYNELDNNNKARQCCKVMLRKWLETDTAASWRKLFTVIESAAVSTSYRGDLSLYIAS